MASIVITLPAKPIAGFHNSSLQRAQFPSLTVPKLDFTAPPNLRSNGAITLQVKQRLLPIVFASNANPSDGDSLKEKPEVMKTSDTVPGPPLLTILAGFVVLFGVLWILGSIIVSLVAFIVNLSPFK